MLKIGITGGIGSGKTTVCRVFETLGIPVFYADLAAKHLMQHDPELKKALQHALGENIYENGILKRSYLAQLLFSNPTHLETVNSLVHPAVIRYGHQWMQQQKSPYAIKEAALFFESGSYAEMDYMITVAAPEALRIQRVIDRDNISVEEVQKRIAKQLPEKEKITRSDFVIQNDDIHPVLPQVLLLHAFFIGQATIPPKFLTIHTP